MSPTVFWIVGGGGLLGSHLCRAVSQRIPTARFWEAKPVRFSWTEPTRLADELRHAVAAFSEAVRAQGGSWALLWCAGKGVMSSPATTLDPEWLAWTRLLELLGHHLAGHCGDLRGVIFLASSAGGIYGGDDELLSEHTPPHPLSAYGRHKLCMEQALRNWADAFPNVSTLIGRISTLYGPGQDLRKAQGMISHLSRCMIFRQPVNIYVSLDTRRDYLFVDDCAHQIAASLGRLITERQRAILKIFASEEPTSVARIIGIFFRMSKHHPLIVSQQPRGTRPTSVKLRSAIWRDLPNLRKTDLTTGIHLVHEHQRALFCRGLLSPP